MKIQSISPQRAPFMANITAALMVLATLTFVTACSPKPSAEETAAQNKALVAQAVEEAKKGMLADQAAEKTRQDALAAAQAEEKSRQAAAVAAARREGAAEQRAAAARARSQQRSSAESTNANSAKHSACSNCGVVLAVNMVETAGKGSGLGVVTGGVVGGLLGSQVGKGSGRDLATIAGVVGGAVAGNAIEKNSKKTKSYDITVKMDNGEERIVHQAIVPDVVSGDHVRIENDVIVKK